MNLIKKVIFIGIFVIIVEVVLPFPIRNLFKYCMPDGMTPVIGGRVIVPFRSRYIIAIVVSFCHRSHSLSSDLKYVKALFDRKSLYSIIQLNIVTWLCKNYFCPKGTVFFSILPKFFVEKYRMCNKHYQSIFVREKCYLQKIIKRYSKKNYHIPIFSVNAFIFKKKFF